MLQLYTANFNLFKMAVQYQFFPILMVQMLFPRIQQAPGPNFRTVGKSLDILAKNNFEKSQQKTKKLPCMQKVKQGFS